MEISFIIVVSFIIIKFCSHTKTSEAKPHTRDLSIDILRAFLIILMIIGHVPIDGGFRRFIYSFHMMAFVMVSGYFYKSGLPFGKNLKKTFKLLYHYALFGILYLAFTPGTLLAKIQTLVLGVSYTKDLLPNAISIGPVYFILLLFVVRLVYVFVDLIRNEWMKNCTVIGIFIAGLLLGKCGYWLPWTVDGALVSLLFYHIAHYIKKYDLLKKSQKYIAIYFPLSCLWAYLIYMGGMEIAIREYGNIAIMVTGNLAAFFIAYLLCHYLANHLPHWISVVLAWIGQSTAYILILHTLFGVKIQHFATNTLSLNPNNIFHLAFCIVTQISIGTICCLIITYSKKIIFLDRQSKIHKRKVLN
jgi:fucose 4-O-acetylase-like acetyltransferase